MPGQGVAAGPADLPPGTGPGKAMNVAQSGEAVRLLTWDEQPFLPRWVLPGLRPCTRRPQAVSPCPGRANLGPQSSAWEQTLMGSPFGRSS